MNPAARAAGTGAGSGRPSARGQATVEFALLLPVVILLALAVGQVAIVAHDRVVLTHSAREGVRVAAVGGSDGEVHGVVMAASRFDAARVQVSVARSLDTVEVVVRYSSPTDLPLVGALVHDAGMVAVARMRRENPP